MFPRVVVDMVQLLNYLEVGKNEGVGPLKGCLFDPTQRGRHRISMIYMKK